MKNIKTYKLFESKEDILQDIRDICLELNDIGIEVKEISYDLFIQSTSKDTFGDAPKYRPLSKGDNISFIIRRLDPRRLLNIRDVSETIYRMIDYMKIHGYDKFEVVKSLRTSKNITGDFKKDMKYSKFNDQGISSIYLNFNKDSA